MWRELQVKRDLTEKWMQLWYSAILRSLVSHFLHAKPLSFHLTEEQREELERVAEHLRDRAADRNGYNRLKSEAELRGLV